jgi:hypothetical protein
MSRYVLGIVVAVLLTCVAGAAQAELVVNPDCAPGGGGWNLQGGHIDFISNYAGRADVIWMWCQSGQQAGQLTSHLITAGDQIAVTLDACETATNGGWGGGPIPFEVTLQYDDGVNPSGHWFAYTDTETLSTPTWKTFTDVVTYTVPNDSPYIGKALGVMVAGMGGAYNGELSIDNVHLTVTPAPEPSTLVLLGTGALSLVAYAWRKRKLGAISVR